MRRFLTLVLIALLLAQPFGMTWIYLSFRINQAYIAKNLCVQKEIKGNKCQGCCQLKKKLHETEQQENGKLPPAQKLRTEIILMAHEISEGLQRPQCSILKTAYFLPDDRHPRKRYLTGIFHPPEHSSASGSC